MTSEVEVLASVKHQIGQAAPRLAVVVDSISDRPLIAPTALNVSIPHPPDGDDRDRYVPWKNWHFDVYLLAKGTIFNPGPDAVRLFPLELRFIQGKSPVNGQDVPVPQKIQAPEPAVIFYPGQLACFELLVQQQVWDWIDDAEADTRPVKITKAAIAMPASADDPSVHITFSFEIYGKVVTKIKPQHEGATVGDLRVLVGDECPSSCQIDQQVRYPESIDWLHAQMTNDEDKLEELARAKWNQEAIRAMLKRQREGEEHVSPVDS